MTSSGRPVPPGSTPPRELAHAIAGALTLRNDVADHDELDYLRATRDAGGEKWTSQLAAGDTTAADPYSAFIEAIIATLSISPCSPETSGRAYLQSARQRARRVLLACRRALESPRIEDADLAAAAGLLGQLDASDEAVGEGQADQSEMIP